MNIFFRTYTYRRQTPRGKKPRKAERKVTTIVSALPTIDAMRDVTLAPLEPLPGRLWRGCEGRTYRWNTVRKLLEIGLVENVEGRIVEARPARKPVKEPA